MNRTWWTGLLTGIAIGAVVLTAVTTLNAQGRGAGGGGGVACLDVGHVFNEYQRQKDLSEEMRVVERETQDEVERRRGQIDSLQATLDAMSDDDPTKIKRQREMLQLQFDYKNWRDLMQADMAREIGLWTRKMYTEILGTAEEIAQRQGYDVVLYLTPPELVGYEPDAVREQIRSRSVVYASPRVDITQAVLDELNARYRAQPKTQMLQISPTMQTIP
jgi:Skp family chaperone for outer membrane proteins